MTPSHAAGYCHPHRCTVIAEEVGLKLDAADISMLGQARQVRVNKEETIIVDGRGDTEEVKARINQIRAEIEKPPPDFDREKLQERLAKLAGGKLSEVGAATETELKEKKHRIEDALAATRAAVEEGIIAGGGTALVDALSALDELKVDGDEKVGVDIVRRALEAPVRQIASNAGAEGSVIVEHVKGKPVNVGFNALTGEFVDMFAAGIVDPVKVTRSALQNAASIAAMLLTTEAIVTDIPEEKIIPLLPRP